MSNSNPSLAKGFGMEESLRAYFLKTGYYVVRGVPFIYEQFDVTDIDLWLYSRNSSVSREITIVDAKNKKTPQAIERIFWVQGLKLAVKATNAIVATTERRPEVKNFGQKLGIVVLDGHFLSRIKSENPLADRLSDEEFFEKIKNYQLSKLDGDWKERVRVSKSLLAESLSFDNCNWWLIQANFFAEQAISKQKEREIALRCLYLICSFITIAVDFCMKEISLYELSERAKMLKSGFTFGSRGYSGTQKLLDLALNLVGLHAPDGRNVSNQVRLSVERQLEKLDVSILAEFFSKNDVAKNLFSISREFEQLAMNRNFLQHNLASIELRSTLFCLLDFWKIPRAIFNVELIK